MQLKYQFNKVSMQLLQKQLAVRRVALPILKSRESVLRMTEKKQKEIHAALEERYRERVAQLEGDIALWAEFPRELYSMKSVTLQVKKIAGIPAPDVKSIDFSILDHSHFSRPKWLGRGIEILRELTSVIAELEVAAKGIEIIERVRRKTTQKVNLYEKVQIPAFEEALRRIKRFMEDEANLDKAVQKMTKQRAEERREGA
jgi:V/A-type H+-transporting ATPase subunit D